MLLLAGGQGERLHPLTKKRAKPAVPFGGIYRIIDFTLSNCLNSGLKQIYVLTQHKSLSLDRHVRTTWSILQPELGEFIQTVPPQLQLVSRWYAGTADAVFQNLDLLDEERPENVLVVSGDHVYRMDYDRLIRFHVERGADVTIACTQAPRADARRMGVVQTDDHDRIVGFDEKPEFPVPIPHDPTCARVNMGIYVFRTEALVRAVIADAKTSSLHDFGHSVIPAMVPARRTYAFDVRERSPASEHYWQDVGTLDTYFDTTMALLEPEPEFDLFADEWPVRHQGGQHPPALLRSTEAHDARVRNSIVSPGCVVSGGSVVRSVLSPGVRIGPGAEVTESILLPGVRVGAGGVLRRVIVEENVVIPDGVAIGGNEGDRRFTVTANGITVVPEGILLG